MAKPAGSSGNSKLVNPPKAAPRPAAPGMGPGGGRTVKGPKVQEKQKPASRGMGGVAGPTHGNSMGKYKP